jgi:hypothetical protein
MTDPRRNPRRGTRDKSASYAESSTEKRPHEAVDADDLVDAEPKKVKKARRKKKIDVEVVGKTVDEVVKKPRKTRSKAKQGDTPGPKASRANAARAEEVRSARTRTHAPQAVMDRGRCIGPGMDVHGC